MRSNLLQRAGDHPAAIGFDRPSMRLLLVEEQDLIRKGMCLLLRQEFGVDVIEASNARDALAWGADPSIDLCILAARLGDEDNLWLLHKIRAERSDLPVLVLSTSADDDTVQAAVDAGANGYLVTASTTQQLREAVETALAGRGVYLHPAVALSMMNRRRNQARYDDLLSEREVAIVSLLAAGATNTEIAGRLYLSEKTVKSHLSNIFRKLEVSNRTQAVAKLIRIGLIDLEAAVDLLATPAEPVLASVSAI